MRKMKNDDPPPNMKIYEQFLSGPIKIFHLAQEKDRDLDLSSGRVEPTWEDHEFSLRFQWRWWTVLPWQRSGREVKCVLHQLRWSWTHQTLSLRPDTSTSYSLHHVILLKQGFFNGSLQHISFIKVKVLWGNFYLKSRYTFAKALEWAIVSCYVAARCSLVLVCCKVFQVGLVCCYAVQIEFFCMLYMISKVFWVVLMCFLGFSMLLLYDCWGVLSCF